MLHANCGGKLTVKDSMMVKQKNGVIIRRIRRCNKCGSIIISTENVQDGMIEQNYIHGNK